MSGNTLRLAPQLALPVDVAGEAIAILAKRGAGKSNTAKVIVEEILDTQLVQVVVLDPVGHWWSLRAGANGKPGGGYDVAVFGGPHGDLPLEPTAGKVLAETAVESGQSIILDVSGLDSDGAMQRFAYEFAERLYTLKQASPSPLLLVLEEADEFAPQDTRGPNVPRMVGAYARLMKRGRGRGIGMLVVTQRSAALSKNVLDQADALIVMRTVGPRDRAAIEGWIKHQSAAGADEVLPSLPGLATGEAWVWNPERDLLKRVKVRKARTFDSTQSARPGQTAVVAEVKPIDVDALGAAIAATVERAKENDPAELRKRIKELERQLAERPAEQVVETVTERVEVPVLAPGNTLETVLLPVLKQTPELLERTLTEVERLIALVNENSTLPRAAARPRAAQSGGSHDRRAERAGPREPERRPAAAPSSNGGPSAVSASEQKILDGLLWLEALSIHEASRVQAAFLAGYKAGGGRFVNLLGGLNTAGLVYYPRSGYVALTAAGRALAHDPGLPRTNEAFHQAVLARLDGSQGKILTRLLVAYPNVLDRETLGAETGYEAKGGRFVNLLGSLRTLGLIDYPAAGYVAALPVLFPEDA